MLISSVVLGIASAIILLFLLDPVSYFFGASESTIPYVRDYMQITLYDNAVTYTHLGLNVVLYFSGLPKMAMCVTSASAVTNYVLNPLSIFGFR